MVKRTTADSDLALQFVGVDVRFGGFTALDDLNLSIAPGRVTGLVGPNGAGKTTIVNVASGLLKPGAGHVFLAGREITSLPPWKIARQGLARSYQDLRLYGALSVLDNVASVPVSRGMRIKQGRCKAMGWLEEFGLSEVAKREANSLSYAESKRLSLARVFATEADVVLLDEPGSGLDEQSTREMIDLLRNIVKARGTTALLVEHNLDLIRSISDEVAFLANGRLVATGAPDEIFSRQDLSELYFGVGATEGPVK